MAKTGLHMSESKKGDKNQVVDLENQGTVGCRSLFIK